MRAISTVPPTGDSRKADEVHHDKNDAQEILKRAAKLIASDAPATTHRALEEELEWTPYRNPRKMSSPEEEREIRKTLNFGVKLAELLLQYGSGARDVESSTIAATTALGLDHTQVVVSNQSLIITYAHPQRDPISILQIARATSRNFTGITLIHQLVQELAQGKLNRAEAFRRLEAIENRKKPYAAWLTVVAHGMIGGSVVGVAGGNWLTMLIGFIACASVALVSRYYSGNRWPEFFVTAFGAATATLIALIPFNLGLNVNSALVITGGIVVILPASRAVSSIQDAIGGFPVTAAARTVSVGLVTVGLITGVTFALHLGMLLGLHPIDFANDPGTIHNLWWQLPLVAIGAVMNGINGLVPSRILLGIAFTAVTGYTAYTILLELGLGSRFSPGLAACVMGVLAALFSRFFGTTQLVVAIPSIVSLLPGMLILRSLYDIAVVQERLTHGLVGLVDGVIICFGIGGGIVYGEYLVNAITKKPTFGLWPHKKSAPPSAVPHP